MTPSGIRATRPHRTGVLITSVVVCLALVTEASRSVAQAESAATTKRASSASQPVVQVAPSLAAASRFRPADRPRTFRFPADHGSHADAKVEWWYVTGKLSADDGSDYGFQFTVFRVGIEGAPESRPSRLAVRDLFIGHAALTDVTADRFLHAERGPYGRLNQGGAAEGRLDVRIEDWRLFESEDGAWRLTVAASGEAPFGFELDLRAAKPVVLHGASPGWSRKGDLPRQSSYYSSFTDLRGDGFVTVGGLRKAVRARAWFDHEFGSDQLAADVVGWDWFSVRLDDGSDLMIYRLRRKDAPDSPWSSGTFVRQDGTTEHLTAVDFTATSDASWTSPRSGAVYPARWRIVVPKAAIDLRLKPAIADQELSTDRTTRVTYYEGLIEGSGTRAGRPVRADGYAELVGYAGAVSRF